jgi:hypothetical protein
LRLGGQIRVNVLAKWQNLFLQSVVASCVVLQLAATNYSYLCLSAEHPFTASPISGILSENQFNCVENGGNG